MEWKRMTNKVSKILNYAKTKNNITLKNKCVMLLKRYSKGERSVSLYKLMDSVKTS